MHFYIDCYLSSICSCYVYIYKGQNYAYVYLAWPPLPPATWRRRPWIRYLRNIYATAVKLLLASELPVWILMYLQPRTACSCIICTNYEGDINDHPQDRLTRSLSLDLPRAAPISVGNDPLQCVSVLIYDDISSFSR